MANNNAIIYNSLGQIVMIVVPDFDSQLNDPAFNPKGCAQVQIPVQIYNQCQADIDIHNACINVIQTNLNLSPLVANIQTQVLTLVQQGQVAVIQQNIVAIGA